MSASLPEVPFATAKGAVADIYAKLMRWSGSGSPALIYRHLATFPGLMEWCWRAVGPELESRALQPTLLGVVDTTTGVTMPPLAPNVWADLGINDDDRALVATMLTSYDRMNTVNFALIGAIRELVDAPSKISNSETPNQGAASVEPPPPVAAMPAPADVDAMAPDLRDAVLSLSSGVPDIGSRVVPTLYRHLALWPDLMLAIAEPLQREFDSGAVDSATERLREHLLPSVGEVTARARKRINGPAPVDDAAALVRTLDAFLVVIPQLVVVGRAIDAALPKMRAAQ